VEEFEGDSSARDPGILGEFDNLLGFAGERCC
jgi:hypothetical protein